MKYTQEPVVGTTWTNGGTAELDGGKLTLTNITPGDKVELNIVLNNKSNVYIQYRTVVMLKAEEDDNVSELASALIICQDNKQIYSGNTDPTKSIIYNSPARDKFYTEWKTVDTIPSTAAGEPIGTSIPMSVELPLTAGNALQGKNCKLYFLVEAVQFNANTVDESNETFVKNDLEALNAKLHTSEEDKNPTMFDALTKAAALFAEDGALHNLAGHLVGKKIGPNMLAVENGYEFAWDSVNDRFIYMRGTTPIYPTNNIPTDNYKIFKVKNTFSDADGYSVYLQTGYSAALSPTLLIDAGLDVGNNTGDFSIKYERTEDEAHDVIIRTNSNNTELVVNAPSDTIYHYGKAGTLNIIQCAMNSYEENGEVAFVEIAKGRIALMENSNVDFLHFHATTEKDFKQIIVAADENTKLPAFSRDEAIVKDNGTLVVELQKDTKNDENTQSDFVWLYKLGVFTQNVVTTTEAEGIEKGDDGNYYAIKGTQKTEVELLNTAMGHTGEGQVDAKTAKATYEISNNLTPAYEDWKKQVTIGGEAIVVPELDRNDDIIIDGDQTGDEPTKTFEEAAGITEGMTADEKKAKIDAVIEEVIEEGGWTKEQASCNHAFGEPVIVEPTCYSEGSQTRTCGKCNVIVAKTIAKVPHKFYDNPEDSNSTESTYEEKCIWYDHCQVTRGPVDVCKIDDTEYRTLRQALATITVNTPPTTITMIADEAIKGNGGWTIPEGSDVVIDLNGHQMYNLVDENKASQVIANKGTLTIRDCTDIEKNGSGTGKLWNQAMEGAKTGEWWSNPQCNYVTNVITNSGILNIESGYILDTAATSICYAIDNNSSASDATLNIKGGLIQGQSTAVRMFCNSTTKKNEMNVSGGIIKGNTTALWIQLPGSSGQKKLGTLNVSGGTLEGGSYAFYDYSFGDLYDEVKYSLSGGTFNGAAYAFFSYGANIEITGGTYNGDIAIKQAKPSAVSVKEGTFAGDCYTYGDNATKTFIEGGTFLTATYVYEGVTYDCDWLSQIVDSYQVVDNGDGTFTVVAKSLA